MNMAEMISRRRSVRAYKADAIDAATLADIRMYMETLVHLIPGVKVVGRIIPTEHGNYWQKWKTPHVIAIFSDGSEYYGYGFGSGDEKITEIVFNTSPVGYQEIISDPSYTYQMVVMTYPLIGNYGIAEDDFETETPTIGGLVVRDYNDQPSNFRSQYTLSEIMKKYQIPGIYGIDTRKNR